MTLNMASTGPPKIKKNASRKGKKNWRKNIDMTEVEESLEEKRLEERTGGILEVKKDSEIFLLDSGGVDPEERMKKKKKREIKPLRCHANLSGLPGVPDPKPIRNRTRTAEERMNPVVKRKLKSLAESGILSKKMKGALLQRANHLEKKKATEQERQTRRRTKFDFDLWDEEQPGEQKPEEERVEKDWLDKETLTHTDVWTNKHIPKEAKQRNEKSQTSLPAVEVPHPGQSYNPSLADHRDVLWKAALVEMKKEKEEGRIERTTTAMFPSKAEAPTQKSYLQEMSEGILELGGKVEEEEEEGEEKEVEDKADSDEEEEESKGPKPKTRKQRRDMKVRAIKERKLLSMKKGKEKENEIFKIKTFKKDLKRREALTKARQKKKEEEKQEKLRNPVQLSSYKYEAPEIEIKLTDELTGNLRNLKPEGSLLEDRYKSLQRRNIIETRVVHKRAKAKSKKVEKRSYKMGFEDDLRKQKQRRRDRAKHKRKMKSDQ